MAMESLRSVLPRGIVWQGAFSLQRLLLPGLPVLNSTPASLGVWHGTIPHSVATF